VGGTATFAANPTLSAGTANQVQYLNGSKVLVGSANLTFDGTTLTANAINTTTLDLTNIEVTNVKAKDGTSAATIADSTGVVSFTANPVLSAGTANGVTYLNGSKVLTSGSALTFDGTNFNAPAAIVSGSIGMLYGNTFSAGNSQTWLTNNATASDTYRTADTAQRIRMLTGIGFTWETAATGTIGGAISWSEQMRLTSTGLGIGGTPAVKLDVVGSTTSGLRLKSNGAASNGFNLYNDSSTDIAYLMNFYNGSMVFGVNNTEQMRLTSTGLGIGTSSPSAKLTVNSGASTTVAQFTSTGSSGFLGLSSSSASAFIGTDSTGAFLVQTPGSGYSTKMLVDSSGNLGLGVTPSAWSLGASGRALQIGTYSAFYENGSGYPEMSFNSYQTGGSTWTYLTSSNPATRFSQTSGAFQFFTAPSGTAGNPISFSQVMTLDASGNLGVGTTATVGRLTVDSGSAGIYGAFNSSNANGGYLEFRSSGTVYGDIGTAAQVVSGSASDFGINARGSRNLIFGTYNLERARITSGGDLLVGTTSAIGSANDRLQVDTDTASARASIFRNATSDTDTIAAWNAATTGDNKFVQFYTDAGANVRGSITYNRAGGLVAYNTTSDYRAKDIFGPVANPGATIDGLKVYEGQMKGATQSRPMLVAHEAQAVAPYSVTGEKDAVNEDGTPKFQQMDVSSLVPLLIAEIQSLRARVAALEA
jgi:hypothetical protein